MIASVIRKFKENPMLYYAMSIAASWAGVGSMMNSITLTHTCGLIPSMIWGLGNSVAEIGKQLGMKPEEVFRLSGFTRDDFLALMTKGHDSYSNAVVYTHI